MSSPCLYDMVSQSASQVWRRTTRPVAAALPKGEALDLATSADRPAALQSGMPAWPILLSPRLALALRTQAVRATRKRMRQIDF